jgi:hypothetical protein
MKPLTAPRPSGSDGWLAQQIGKVLASYMGQPVDVIMKLILGPELKKLGMPIESLSRPVQDEFLQRMSLKIMSYDGKLRAAFLEEARKITKPS